MTITLEELKNIFSAVIRGDLSREEASDRAIELQQAADDNNLHYIPAEKEYLMWDAILFLLGVDLRSSPNEYLHNKTDIDLELKKLAS